jgi:uncharacterized protein
MQIKRSLMLGLISVVLATAQQPLTKEAKIDRMLAVTNASSMIDQMFAQIQKMTSSMLPPGATPEETARMQKVQSQVMVAVKERLSWEKMRPQYVKLYSDTFTDSEIDGLLAFYESPAGQAMLKKMPELMGKSMALGQAQMGDIMPEIQRIIKEGSTNPR